MKVVGTTVVRTLVWPPLSEVVVSVTELVARDNETDAAEEVDAWVADEDALLLLCAATPAAQSRQRAIQNHCIVKGIEGKVTVGSKWNREALLPAKLFRLGQNVCQLLIIKTCDAASNQISVYLP